MKTIKFTIKRNGAIKTILPLIEYKSILHYDFRNSGTIVMLQAHVHTTI